MSTHSVYFFSASAQNWLKQNKAPFLSLHTSDGTHKNIKWMNSIMLIFDLIVKLETLSVRLAFTTRIMYLNLFIFYGKCYKVILKTRRYLRKTTIWSANTSHHRSHYTWVTCLNCECKCPRNQSLLLIRYCKLGFSLSNERNLVLQGRGNEDVSKKVICW